MIDWHRIQISPPFDSLVGLINLDGEFYAITMWIAHTTYGGLTYTFYYIELLVGV